MESERGLAPKRVGGGRGEGQVGEFQGGRTQVAGTQIFGVRADVLVCKGCLEGGAVCLHLESVPFSSLSAVLTGLLNTTFLLLGCARGHHKLLSDFHHIGNIRVTEVLNILEKAQVASAERSSHSPAWSILSSFLLAFRD